MSTGVATGSTEVRQVPGPTEQPAAGGGGHPRIGYLVGRYPGITHTFILHEVLELRAQGVDIAPFSIWRSSADELPSAAERAEFDRTCSLLPPDPAALLATLVGLAARHPLQSLRLLRRALELTSPGIRNRVLGFSWFVEAALMRRHCIRRDIRHLHVHLNGTAQVVALLTTELGNAIDAHRRGREPWSWSMTIHGSKEFYDVARERLDEKVAAASFVVCISDYTRSQVMAFSAARHWSKLHVVPCGIDTDVYTPVDRSSARSARILTVGRLDNMKGVPILIEALAELSREGHDVVLTVVGEGPERAALERLAADLGIADRVEWTGTVGQDRIREIYRRADIFCLPSFAEGIPIVLMEAMATEMPVVANRITGIPELIEEEVSGLLVRAGRVEDLTSALRRLVADPALRSNLGRAGRRRVIERHRLAESACALVALHSQRREAVRSHAS